MLSQFYASTKPLSIHRKKNRKQDQYQNSLKKHKVLWQTSAKKSDKQLKVIGF